MVFVGNFDKVRIEAEIEDFLFRRGYELVDLKLEANSTRPYLEVFADKLGGITVKDLSELNGALQLFLEASEFFPSMFQLAVSSPGLDRVVKKESDFNRFAGRKITYVLNNKEKNSGKKKAVLLGFEDGKVILELSDKTVERLPLSEIKTVRLVPDIDFKIDGAKAD